MSEKKNFSTLGKIDEKFVEEADAYVVGKDAPAARRGKKRPYLRAAGIAAGLLIVASLSAFAFSVFSPAKNASGDMNAAEGNFGEADAPSEGDADGAGEGASDDTDSEDTDTDSEDEENPTGEEGNGGESEG